MAHEFKIWHPKHGEAQCSDWQWPEFEALGWKREKASADPVAVPEPARGRKVKP